MKTRRQLAFETYAFIKSHSKTKLDGPKRIKRKRATRAKVLRAYRKKDRVRTSYGCDARCHEYRIVVGWNACTVQHKYTDEIVAIGDGYDMRIVCESLNGGTE